MGDKEKIMWNFYAAWWISLVIVTQFCGVSRGEALVCRGFLG